MRLALLSDIHGNPLALDAVLAEIQAQGGVDSYLVVGDMPALGYDPVGVLECLATLPNAVFTRGNTDRYTVTGDRPPPTAEDVQRNPALQTKYDEVTRSFAWTRQRVQAAGWLDWLAALPLEHRLTLPNGARLLAVHASPGRDDGGGILPTLTDAEIATLVSQADADLIIVGHTHQPLDRTVHGVRVVNLGSLSNPATNDLRAMYAILDATPQGYRVTPCRVPYDWRAVLAALDASDHPARAFIASHWRKPSTHP
jgi:predicted phosphodiesterase